MTDADAAALPGHPFVVGYAPQLDLLARARVTFTHAGLNTVLDSLANGVPFVTVPITYEQPAIARRVERIGAGRTLSIRALTVERLRRTLQDVLDRSAYHDSARRMRDAILEAGGVRKAASVVGALIAQ